MRKLALLLLCSSLVLMTACPNDTPQVEDIGMFPLTSGFKVLTLGGLYPEPGNVNVKLKVYDATGNDETAAWGKNLVSGSVLGTDNSLGVDSLGNVYIAVNKHMGNTGYDWYLNKYLTSGESDAAHWEKSFDGGYGGHDIIVALVVDPSDSIYVIGFNRKNDSDYDWRIKKFSSDGVEDTLHWNKSLDSGGSPTWDMPSAAAVDSLGNLYVAGNLGSTFFIKKYAPDGTEITTGWNKVVAAVDAMKVDSADNLCIASTSNVATQYKSNGDFGWTSSTNVGMYVYGIAIDSDRNVYVVGGNSGGGGRIKKYDSAGTEVTTGWDKTLPDYLEVNSAAIGPDKSLYVAGYFNGGGGPTIWDWRLGKFLSDGTADAAWSHTLDANNSSTEGLSLVAVTIP